MTWMSALHDWRMRYLPPRARAWWPIWVAVLATATIGMLGIRDHLDKAHVALTFLLIVLGASAAGGRALGIAMAGTAFLAINWFFIPPYLTLVIANPFDWLVLLAFLITSLVATQLLYRATSTAEAATARAAEVDRLAALGAETLNAPGAQEALQAIVGVIQGTLAVDECDVFTTESSGRLIRAARAPRPSPSPTDATPRPLQDFSLAEWIVEQGRSAVELGDGTVRIAPSVSPLTEPHGAPAPGERLAEALVGMMRRDAAEPAPGLPGDSTRVRALAIPLTVRGHTVGVLRLASARGLELSVEQLRLLTALAYYAALGVERVRLTEHAERAESERRVEALRSALLTAVSHDLRTPLTTIKGLAHEIAHGADGQQAVIIEREADRLDALVADFLDLSRIHAGAVTTQVAVNTVDDLIGAALQRAAGMLGGRTVDIDATTDELLAGQFDFSQSLRIVVNLLDNAAKYAPAGSPITIRTERHGDRLTIAVLDRGPGVPATERERIFEPFYRPPMLPPDVRGTGLGLSIARGLAEAQGGSLRYEPRTGGGSVFTLELPGADSAPLDAPSE
ncbi:MAG: ATP-binding protein [Gemmatimonadaceae bacterium]